jgi:hypothetical protein
MHLSELSHPNQLHGLSVTELEAIARQIRERHLEVVSTSGGHLGPGLGVVELTLALYQTLDLDHDKVVWDVGHQAYPHKLITGRYHNFDSLRQQGGVAGYLKRGESRFDHFGAGHAALLAQGVEAVITAGDQLVGIGLVAHNPHHLVVVEIQRLVEGDGEFHHPQARTQVAAAGAHHLQVAFADLAGDRFEFGDAESVQLVGVAQLAEMHSDPCSEVQSRGCFRRAGADCDTGRHG